MNVVFQVLLVEEMYVQHTNEMVNCGVASGAVFLTVMLIFCSSSLRDASSVLSCTAEDGFFNILKYRAKKKL